MNLETQDTCVEWVKKWTLRQLEGQELTPDLIHLTTEQVMRDWDLYCGRDFPHLPELNDDEWDGCLESVRESVECELM
jgi:hypothetical protein